MDNKYLKMIADELRLIRKELQKIRSAIMAEQPVSTDGKEMVENAVQCTNRELSSVPDELR